MVCVCVCVCVRARVHVRVCVCVRVRVCVCVCDRLQCIAIYLRKGHLDQEDLYLEVRT